MGLHSVLAFTIIVPVSIAGRELAVCFVSQPKLLESTKQWQFDSLRSSQTDLIWLPVQ